MSRAAHPFAPGAIERHTRQRVPAHQRAALLLWMLRALVLMALTGTTGLVAGLIVGVMG